MDTEKELVKLNQNKMYKMDQKQYLHEVGQNLADLFYNRNKMEAKLILKKTSTGFYLWRNPLDKSQELIGATVPIMNDNGVDLREYTLSLKNCEAIERGYDLDELAELEAEKRHDWDDHDDTDIYNELIREDAELIKIGMQKILEILGNKKFSEDDIRKALTKGYLMKFNPSDEYQKTLSDFLQSLQQTEWEVSCNPDVKDADGNLILKRK